MTQEERDILLKDICARLPYGIKVNNEIQGDFNIYGICENFVFGRNEVCHIDFDIEKIKPYLFPLSSMSDEQKKEIEDILIKLNLMAISDEIGSEVIASYEIDFYNKNHFDYRGLIPMGFAIDATGLDIYE
jgi:hypothetical protein